MTDVPIIRPRYPGIAKAVATHLARRVIEQRMRSQGLRITRYAVVVEQAQVYLAEHREELMEQALARVQASPWHSMMAEREERDRRKSRVVERAMPTCLHNR